MQGGGDGGEIELIIRITAIFLFKQQEGRRPKISHRWQIVLFDASPLDNRYRLLPHTTHGNGALNEPPGGAAARRQCVIAGVGAYWPQVAV